MSELVERLRDKVRTAQPSSETGQLCAEAADRIEALEGEVAAWRAATAELLSAHDNLYIAHFGPHSDPRNDIASRAARSLSQSAEESR